MSDDRACLYSPPPPPPAPDDSVIAFFAFLSAAWLLVSIILALALCSHRRHLERLELRELDNPFALDSAAADKPSTTKDVD